MLALDDVYSLHAFKGIVLIEVSLTNMQKNMGNNLSTEPTDISLSSRTSLSHQEILQAFFASNEPSLVVALWIQNILNLY